MLSAHVRTSNASSKTMMKQPFIHWLPAIKCTTIINWEKTYFDAVRYSLIGKGMSLKLKAIKVLLLESRSLSTLAIITLPLLDCISVMGRELLSTISSLSVYSIGLPNTINFTFSKESLISNLT